MIAILGKNNDMADVASRYSSDGSPNLLSYFNLHFPQASSWEQFHLPPTLTSLVMSSLLGEQSTLESRQQLLVGLMKNTGQNGMVTQTPSKWTHYSKTPIPLSATLSLQHSLQGSDWVILAEESKSKYKVSLMH